MSAIARQKACITCAEAKRKCDKQLPSCRRCIDQGLDCLYPQRKKRRVMRPSPLDPGLERATPALVQEPGATTSEHHPDLPWPTTMTRIDLDAALSDWTVPSLLPFVTAQPKSPNHSLAPSTAWFLSPETWTLHQSDQLTACIIATDLEPFMTGVREELETWARTTTCNFIHHKLYEYGMPACLQDAFTTCAAYFAVGGGAAAKAVVLQIADERASALVHTVELEGTLAVALDVQLARVQALSTYTTIRLFDPSVRLRASAEKQLPILRAWFTQLWETAKTHRASEPNTLLCSPTPSPFDIGYCTASTVWRAWIVAESVRRTHLVANFVVNVYRCMTEGYAACDGAAMITVSCGLWDARSTQQWSRLVEEKPPMLVPALQPGRWMAEHAADEFDELARKYWGMVVGADKMESWVGS